MKFLIASAAIIGVVISSMPVQANPTGIDQSVCSMNTSSGKTIDLGHLCSKGESKTTTSGTAKKRGYSSIFPSNQIKNVPQSPACAKGYYLTNSGYCQQGYSYYSNYRNRTRNSSQSPACAAGYYLTSSGYCKSYSYHR